MNDHQLLRYSRHILLDEIGIEGQEKILAARVLVVGCGGLGAAALPYLAASGVGKLIIADHDTIDDTNLQRQTAFTEADIGQAKAQVMAGRLKAAKAWADWESYLIRFEPQDVDEDAYESLAIARLENHYFVNEGWLKGDKAILANTDKIRHIPTIIVQGRYDLCTPMQSARELSQAFPEAELRIVQAGHSSFDPSLSEALVKAVEDIRSKL